MCIRDRRRAEAAVVAAVRDGVARVVLGAIDLRARTLRTVAVGIDAAGGAVRDGIRAASAAVARTVSLARATLAEIVGGAHSAAGRVRTVATVARSRLLTTADRVVAGLRRAPRALPRPRQLRVALRPSLGPAPGRPPRAGRRAAPMARRARRVVRAAGLFAVAVLGLDLVLGVDAPVIVVPEPAEVRAAQVTDAVTDDGPPSLGPAVDAVSDAVSGDVDPRPAMPAGTGTTPSVDPEPSDDAPEVTAGPTDAVAGPTPVGPLPAVATAPARVVIPALEVASTIVDVGLEPDGALEVPADVSTVGWYVPPSGRGVVPGATGTAVLAGHVDSRVQGPGAFNRLRTLAPGNSVVVVHADGLETVWRVDEVVRYPKSEVPIGEIFVWDGDPRLALITCGGDFDRAARSYLDNYVVLASRVG